MPPSRTAPGAAAAIRCQRIAPLGSVRDAVHDHAVILLFVRGQGVVTQPGRWPAAPGDLQLVPAGVRHGREQPADEALAVAFCPTCLRADGLEDLLAPFEAVRRGRSPVLRPPAEAAPRLRARFELLAEECERDDPASPRARRALLELLLVEIARLGPVEVPAAGGLVAEALAWIEAHALEPIGPADVAAALRRSPTHLTTVVRAETGQTVGQWLVAIRMAEARRRLRDTDERVDVIGERVGYLDPSHFSRVFRRVHGASPTAWRRRERLTTRAAPR